MFTQKWRMASGLRESGSAFKKPLFHRKERVQSGLSSIAALAFVSVFVLGMLLAVFPGQSTFARSEQQRSPNVAAIGSQPAATSPIWYFAEGSVGNSFQEYITLYNPNSAQATASLTYLFQSSRPSQVVTHTVNAFSRFTVNVNLDVGVPSNGPQQSVATIVRSKRSPCSGATHVLHRRRHYQRIGRTRRNQHE